MMAASPHQLLLDREDGASVAPPAQADFRHQPPQAFGPGCIAADVHPPCRLKTGCFLAARGADCLGVCWVALTGI